MWKSVKAFFVANWITIRVVGTFVTLIAVFFGAMTYEPFVQHVDLAAGLARVSAWMSWVFLRGLGGIAGFPVHIDGTNLASGNFVVDVSPACSGAVPSMIYLSAVLAYPTDARAKAIGSVLGLGIIHTVNLIRVVALFLVGLFAHQYFHDTHVYVAQALVICIAVATWIFWAGRFADAPRR